MHEHQNRLYLLSFHLFLHRLSLPLYQLLLWRAIVNDNLETTRLRRAWQSRKRPTNWLATERLPRLSTRESRVSSISARSCTVILRRRPELCSMSRAESTVHCHMPEPEP